MITPKLFLFGAVALASVCFAPAAQAKDHHNHHGDRHDRRHNDYGRYDQRYDNRSYYYNQGPSVVYGDPYYNNNPYYGSSNLGFTFAFGGHRHHHHR